MIFTNSIALRLHRIKKNGENEGLNQQPEKINIVSRHERRGTFS